VEKQEEDAPAILMHGEKRRLNNAWIGSEHFPSSTIILMIKW